MPPSRVPARPRRSAGERRVADTTTALAAAHLTHPTPPPEPHRPRPARRRRSPPPLEQLADGQLRGEPHLNLGTDIVGVVVTVFVIGPLISRAQEGRVREHTRLDYEWFSAQVYGSTSNVKVLDTFSNVFGPQFSERLFRGIKAATGHGARVQILLLDPDSSRSSCAAVNWASRAPTSAATSCATCARWTGSRSGSTRTPVSSSKYASAPPPRRDPLPLGRALPGLLPDRRAPVRRGSPAGGRRPLPARHLRRTTLRRTVAAEQADGAIHPSAADPGRRDRRPPGVQLSLRLRGRLPVRRRTRPRVVHGPPPPRPTLRLQRCLDRHRRARADRRGRRERAARAAPAALRGEVRCVGGRLRRVAAVGPGQE